MLEFCVNLPWNKISQREGREEERKEVHKPWCLREHRIFLDLWHWKGKNGGMPGDALNLWDANSSSFPNMLPTEPGGNYTGLGVAYLPLVGRETFFERQITRKGHTKKGKGSGTHLRQQKPLLPPGHAPQASCSSSSLPLWPLTHQAPCLLALFSCSCCHYGPCCPMPRLQCSPIMAWLGRQWQGASLFQAAANSCHLSLSSLPL